MRSTPASVAECGLGGRLRALSAHHQVVCVTHLAQVAARRRPRRRRQAHRRRANRHRGPSARAGRAPAPSWRPCSPAKPPATRRTRPPRRCFASRPAGPMPTVVRSSSGPSTRFSSSFASSGASLRTRSPRTAETSDSSPPSPAPAGGTIHALLEFVRGLQRARRTGQHPGAQVGRRAELLRSPCARDWPRGTSRRSSAPRPGTYLPDVLAADDVERILDAPPADDPTGIAVRDRAILELLYGCGLRVSELGLDVDRVDLPNQQVRVIGKETRNAGSRWVTRRASACIGTASAPELSGPRSGRPRRSLSDSGATG